MSLHPDNNPDKVSGFGLLSELKSGIPTIIPTTCRDLNIGICSNWDSGMHTEPALKIAAQLKCCDFKGGFSTRSRKYAF